jgi:hypothetical protein
MQTHPFLFHFSNDFKLLHRLRPARSDRFGWFAVPACDSPQQGGFSYEHSPHLSKISRHILVFHLRFKFYRKESGVPATRSAHCRGAVTGPSALWT